MIRNIILPESFQGYYLFPKKIAGVEITTTHVYVTVVYARGKQLTIQNCIQVPIERDNGQEEQERIIQALTKATTGIADAEFHTVISSSHVVFKHLKLPFTDQQKIQKVIAFEVEPLLPFPLADAVIDFIITGQNHQEQTSSIVVTAVQKQYIEQQLAYFSGAGLQPAVITVDLLQLYALYAQHPQLNTDITSIAIIDIGDVVTKIAYVIDGELRFVRTLATGTFTIAKQLAQSINCSAQDCIDELEKYGFEQPDNASYNQAITKACASFVQQVQFSLQSFATQAGQAMQVQHIFLTGLGATYNGCATWLTQQLNIPVTLFDLDAAIARQGVQMNTMSHVPLTYAISTAAALPNERTHDLNLRQQEFERIDPGLFSKQFIAALCLFAGIFIVMGAHNYLQLRTLRKETHTSQQEAINALRKHFSKLQLKGSVDSMIQDVKRKLAADEKLWSPFSAATRNSFLYYLLELSRLDKKSLDLIVQKVTLDQDKRLMRLKAQVKDTDALTLLEQELRQSGLFSYVQSPDYPSFDMELRFADSLNKKEAQ